MIDLTPLVGLLVLFIALRLLALGLSAGRKRHMKLTPLDIRHKDFKRGMRGYVDTEVDTFLDEIADEFERLFKENIELVERCEVLQEKIDHYRTLEETLQKTLVSAQRSAEELKINAQKEAQLILHEAELKARQMVNESYADKQGIEKQIVVMKSSEEDFRFKFRSLLEGYLKQLGSIDEAAAKERRLRAPGRRDPEDAWPPTRRRHRQLVRGAPAARLRRAVAEPSPPPLSWSRQRRPARGLAAASAPAGRRPHPGRPGPPCRTAARRARRPAGRRRERGRRQRVQVVNATPLTARAATAGRRLGPAAGRRCRDRRSRPTDGCACR